MIKLIILSSIIFSGATIFIVWVCEQMNVEWVPILMYAGIILFIGMFVAFGWGLVKMWDKPFNSKNG